MNKQGGKMRECFLCDSKKNLMEVRLVSNGNQTWFWLCDECREGLEKTKGITICLRDGSLVGMSNIEPEEICDTKSDTYDY